MNEAAILFEDLKPGTVMGERLEQYDERQAQRWQAIFGRTAPDDEQSAAEAASMAVISMMRAYLDVVAPRPAGNVHAKQKLHLHSLPRLGDTIHVVVTCVGKEVRRGRKYVELQVRGKAPDTRLLFDGLLTLIWAE